MDKIENYVTVTELMRRWHCSRPSVLRYLRRYKAQLIQFGGGKVLISEAEVARIEALVSGRGKLQTLEM